MIQPSSLELEDFSTLELEQIFIDGLQIREQRELARQYAADQLHISATHCGACGTRLVNGQCPYGCTDAPIEPAGMWGSELCLPE